MIEEELININGIREDLYQAMQIGDKTLNSKHSQDLYDFMNYQDKEIERLNNIIKEVREYITSYESISTIQGIEDIETNKDLDEKTLTEMVRRYMIVHDKILEILDRK